MRRTFPGFKEWGTWWQGEIAGAYFLSSSNLKTHMLHFSVQPTEYIRTGSLFFNYRLDQPGSYRAVSVLRVSAMKSTGTWTGWHLIT